MELTLIKLMCLIFIFNPNKINGFNFNFKFFEGLMMHPIIELKIEIEEGGITHVPHLL